MTEIEDLILDETPRLQRENGTVSHRIKKKIKDSEDAVDSNHLSDSLIPEKIRIFVQTWGCSHNTSDSEYMAGILQQHGYKVTLGGAQDLGISDNNNVTSECSTNSCSSNSNNNAENSDNCCRTIIKEASVFDADLYLFNSCTVKGPAEDHFRNAVNEAKNRGKKVIVAGCVPQGQKEVEYLKNISVIGVQQIDRIIEVTEETLNGNVVHFLQKRVKHNLDRTKKRLAGAPLDLPKIRRNPLIEILAISTGCLNACTYCKTKHARGVLASYTIEELVDRAISAFKDGVKEIWLTSEDLGAYGRDLVRDFSDPVEMACSKWYYLNGGASKPLNEKFPSTLTLADLLARLVPIIPKGCMLRLGMTNPPYILDQLEEISFILKHPHVYGFLHIPVQSGSNSVLQAMKREYTCEDFEKVVIGITKAVEEVGDSISLATDIICGFPTETAQDFQCTVDLVKRFHFPTLFINQFYARPGTPAANMKRITTTHEVKQRTALLHKMFRTYETYSDLLHNELNVLITESSSDGKFWVGHSKSYQQILVPKLPQLLGQIVRIKITECHKFYMKSEILKAGPEHLMDSNKIYQERLILYSKNIQFVNGKLDLLTQAIPFITIAVAATWIYLRFLSKAL